MPPVLDNLTRYRFDSAGYKILHKPVLSGQAEILLL